MKITPLEIRQKSFEKKLRGYDKDEVNAFMNGLSQEWERLNAENKELKTKLVNAERDVQRLREVEASLFKTLKTAEDTGANLIDQAHKTAELHVREAQMQSEAIYNDAQNTAKDLIESAEHQAREIVINAQEEVRSLQNDFKILESQREDLLLQIRSIANETLERVEKQRGRSSNFPQLSSNQGISSSSNTSSNLTEKYEFKPIDTSILDTKPVEREVRPQQEPINTLKTTTPEEAKNTTETPKEEAIEVPKYYEDGENGKRKIGDPDFNPIDELVEEIDKDDSGISPLPTKEERALQQAQEVAQSVNKQEIEETKDSTQVTEEEKPATSIEWQVGDIKSAEDTSDSEKKENPQVEERKEEKKDSSDQGSFFDSL